MDPANKHIAFRCVGGVIVVGAVSALLTLVREAQALLLWGAALFLVVAALAGGVQMLRLRPAGYRLALVSLVPQLISVVVSGFQYRFVMGALVGAGVAGAKGKVRVGTFFETGTQVLLDYVPTVSWWAVQLNLLPAVALILMIWLKPRSGPR